MTEHLFTILTTRQNEFQLFVIYMCLSALALRHTDIDCKILRSKNLLRLATGFGVLVIAIYLMTIVNYLLYPNYVDHVEATVASIAWLGMHGYAFWPDWVTGDIYADVYGPVLYLLHGFFLLIVPTLITTKILGVLSLLVAFGLIYIIIKQKVGTHLASFLFIASLATLFLPADYFAFWSRSEPFLILISTVALLVAIRLQPFAAGAIIGVLAGLAAGFKLHGFLYVAPTAMMTLAQVKTPRDRVILAIIGVACASIFTLLPFCLKEASLTGYAQYLIIIGDHGLSLHELSENITVALVLFAPIVGIWYWRRPAINPSELWLLVGLCISIAITVVVGSVRGGGPIHLLPFVPLCIYAAIIISGAPAAEAPQIIAIIFLLSLIAYGPYRSQLMADFYRNFPAEHDKINELRTYLVAYPDAQIGISDDGHYSDTFYKIFAVLQGHGLHVDFSTWGEMAYAGVPEKYVIRFIKKCEVPTWILPLGAPFTKRNFFTPELPLLSDDFRQTFSMNYKLIQMGQHYQVWACRSSVARRGPPGAAEGKSIAE
jgi:hypothetical protein